MPENPHSYHVFLLPFRWKPEPGPWKAGIPALLGKDWKHVPFDLNDQGDDWYNTDKRYNEYHYFHDFTRTILYDFGPKFRPADGQTALMQHYEYQGNETAGDYVIERMEKGEKKEYRLKVNSILLNLYWMGVGVLSLHLENHTHPEPEDILKINQYGRRVFPPFLPLADSQYSELAHGIGFSHGKTEDYQGYAQGHASFAAHRGLPAHLAALFPARTVPQITLLGDDRMFVHCIYAHAQASRMAKEAHQNPYGNKAFNFLYRYTFVDVDSPTCADDATYQAALHNHIYRRWADYGSFTGITRYSFVTLHTKPSYDYLWAHGRTLYYKLVELTLVQRALILVFQERVSEISGKEGTQVEHEVRTLHSEYLRFVNKVYFREVTAQEQGIELYDLLQRHARIEEQVRNLEGEMRDLDEYATLIGEQHRNQHLDRITQWGAAFLVPTFLAGYLGMNNFVLDKTSPQWPWLILILPLAGILSYYLIPKKRKGSTLRILLLTLMLVSTLFLLGKLLFPVEGKTPNENPTGKSDQNAACPSADAVFHSVDSAVNSANAAFNSADSALKFTTH